MIPGIRNEPYEKRLQILDLPSLYYRRARGDAIECYKYLHGIYNAECNFLELDTSNRRGHTYKLKKIAATKMCRSHFFGRRVTNAWNRLPEDVVSAPSLNTFKNRLDKVWKPYKYSTDISWFV